MARVIVGCGMTSDAPHMCSTKGSDWGDIVEKLHFRYPGYDLPICLVGSTVLERDFFFCCRHEMHPGRERRASVMLEPLACMSIREDVESALRRTGMIFQTKGKMGIAARHVLDTQVRANTSSLLLCSSHRILCVYICTTGRRVVLRPWMRLSGRGDASRTTRKQVSSETHICTQQRARGLLLGVTWPSADNKFERHLQRAPKYIYYNIHFGGTGAPPRGAPPPKRLRCPLSCACGASPC